MKIAVGLFYHEANSFNPMLLKKEDMVHFEGAEVIRRLYASEVFLAAGVELVPLVYALALPNGIMSRECYDFYADRILERLRENRDVDGVFLHLHGSAEVEGLGSGEYDLIKRIRALIGGDKVIGIALDFHANTDLRMPPLINVVRNYRTVPHTDQEATEKTVANAMLNMLRSGYRTVPQFVRLPYAIHPEKALGATWPLSEIFQRLNEMEKNEEIAVATLGCGMMWCDSANLATNVAVTPSKPEHTEFCRRAARELADYVYSLRDSFEFEQLPLLPHDAALYAIRFQYESPVYVSDSGDNTTGGAVGDHTILLREFLRVRDYNRKKVLVTAVWDEAAVEACWEHAEGEAITVTVGKDYDENTRAVTVSGILKRKGFLNGYMGCEHDHVGRCVTVTAGPVDFCVVDRPGSFITPIHFGPEGAGLNMDDYDVIVVKQGYLFAQLRILAKLAILALTPGATHQLVENLKFRRIVPPVYPLNYTGE